MFFFQEKITPIYKKYKFVYNAKLPSIESPECPPTGSDQYNPNSQRVKQSYNANLPASEARIARRQGEAKKN
jgi:hypothetical protein